MRSQGFGRLPVWLLVWLLLCPLWLLHSPLLLFHPGLLRRHDDDGVRALLINELHVCPMKLDAMALGDWPPASALAWEVHTHPAMRRGNTVVDALLTCVAAWMSACAAASVLDAEPITKGSLAQQCFALDLPKKANGRGVDNLNLALAMDQFIARFTQQYGDNAAMAWFYRSPRESGNFFSPGPLRDANNLAVWCLPRDGFPTGIDPSGQIACDALYFVSLGPGEAGLHSAYSLFSVRSNAGVELDACMAEKASWDVSGGAVPKPFCGYEGELIEKAFGFWRRRHRSLRSEGFRIHLSVEQAACDHNYQLVVLRTPTGLQDEWCRQQWNQGYSKIPADLNDTLRGRITWTPPLTADTD